MINLLTAQKELFHHKGTEDSIMRILTQVYEDGHKMGYSHGVQDTRKIMQRVKLRYNILLGWMTDQTLQFSTYTKRYEYKTILSNIIKVKDSYMFENSLNSSYRPKPITNEEGELVDVKKDIAYLLSDVVGDFIKQEELKNK